MKDYTFWRLIGVGWAVGLVLATTGNAAESGYFRVVNTSSNAAGYTYSLRFHRTPWSIRNKSFPGGKNLPAGATSAWIRLGSVVKTAPVTLQIHSSAGSSAGGRLEFAATLDPLRPVRSLEFTAGLLTVECETLSIDKAEEIRTDREIGAATLADVEAMTFTGKAPLRFPTGWAEGTVDELKAGRLLGFTAVHGQPQTRSRELLEALGYRYLYSYSHWLGQWKQGGGGYRRDRNQETADQLAAAWRERGLTGHLWRISIRDEAALDVGESEFAGGMEKDTNYWAQVIALAGLRPDDFIDPDRPPPSGLGLDSLDYWAALRGFKRSEKTRYPEQVYNSLKVSQMIWPLRFGNFREALRRSLGEGIGITANIHMTAYFRDNLSGFDPWLNYSRLQTLDSPQVCDYLVSWPQQEEFLIDLQRCALRPHHHKPVDAMLQAQQRYMPRPPEHLKLCAFSALGAGARSLTFYQWGPRYLATENWYDTDRERLRTIGEINHAAGWVEDILLEGAPPTARVAILYSRPSELWDRLAPSTDIDSPGRYLAERRVLYHLLRGLHQAVDFIQDEVLPAEQEVSIDDYRVIFMSQRCITEKGANLLLDWVRRGGTLVGIGSIGQFNEWEQPWPMMIQAFGFSALSVEFDSGTNTLKIPSLGVTLRNEKAMRGRVAVSDAKVETVFDDGSPAITRKALGQGQLIYVAWGPGNAYHRMENPSDGWAKKMRLLTGMQMAVREVVKPWLMAAGPPQCETDHPLVSARLIVSKQGSAVFLVNSSGEPQLPAVQVILRGVPHSAVTSLMRGPLPVELKDGALRVSLPMGLTDVLKCHD